MPRLTTAADIDLPSWEFALWGGIRIEKPDGLLHQLVVLCWDAMEANAENGSPA